MVSEPPMLGILAGRGDLPRRMIETCRLINRPFFVLAFEGQTEQATVEGTPHAWTRLGAVGFALDTLHHAGVKDIVFAGAIKRPSLLTLKPDAKGAALLARIGLRALGDDGLLRAVSDVLEAEGFRIIGADDVLTSLLATGGPLGRYKPDALAEEDIARGIAVARALGAVDVGQAVVIQQGIVLGVEAIEGTDALIQRTASLRREGLGGVLVKLMKPGQDRRFDLPTIGLGTVTLAASVGLRGIALEAGHVLVLDRERAIEAADETGLFVYGFGAPDAGGTPGSEQ